MSAVPEDAAAEAARAYLRMAGSGEEATLRELARAAFALGEAFTGAPLIARACGETVPASGAWTPLSREPVAAITGLTALPVGAAPFVVPVEGYAVDIDAEGRGWVRVAASVGADRVAVEYRAGLAEDWDGLPAAIRHGVVLLTAHLFEDRAAKAAPPAAVAALWRPYRRVRLADPAKCYFAGTPADRRRA